MRLENQTKTDKVKRVTSKYLRMTRRMTHVDDGTKEESGAVLVSHVSPKSFQYSSLSYHDS